MRNLYLTRKLTTGHDNNNRISVFTYYRSLLSVLIKLSLGMCVLRDVTGTKYRNNDI